MAIPYECGSIKKGITIWGHAQRPIEFQNNQAESKHKPNIQTNKQMLVLEMFQFLISYFPNHYYHFFRARSTMAARRMSGPVGSSSTPSWWVRCPSTTTTCASCWRKSSGASFTYRTLCRRTARVCCAAWLRSIRTGGSRWVIPATFTPEMQSVVIWSDNVNSQNLVSC